MSKVPLSPHLEWGKEIKSRPGNISAAVSAALRFPSLVALVSSLSFGMKLLVKNARPRLRDPASWLPVATVRVHAT